MTSLMTRGEGADAPSGERAGLVLADLVQEEAFRLTLVTGDEDALDRPVCGAVCGAHSVEADVAAAALERNWIVLTTGAGLQGDPDGQRRLVAELDEAGAAA